MQARCRAGERLLGLFLVALLAACGGGGTGDQDGAVPTTPSPAAEEGAAAPTTTTTATDAGETGTVIEVTVAGGSVDVVPGEPAVGLGDEVVLRVSADVVDEVHVHGYDRAAAVVPGEVAELRFVADLPGVWEVELEEAGLELLQLQVS